MEEIFQILHLELNPIENFIIAIIFYLNLIFLRKLIFKFIHKEDL